MDVKTLSLQDRLMSRFLRYAAVTSQSKAGVKTVPSTPGQWDLARLLMKDAEQHLFYVYIISVFTISVALLRMLFIISTLSMSSTIRMLRRTICSGASF